MIIRNSIYAIECSAAKVFFWWCEYSCLYWNRCTSVWWSLSLANYLTVKHEYRNVHSFWIAIIILILKSTFDLNVYHLARAFLQAKGENRLAVYEQNYIPKHRHENRMNGNVCIGSAPWQGQFFFSFLFIKLAQINPMNESKMVVQERCAY